MDIHKDEDAVFELN